MSARVSQAVRSAVVAVALAAVFATTIATVTGQVKPGVKAPTLTPMDYIEIRQLVNRYAFAADTGSNNGYDYTDLFAPDGEFVQPYAKGREQLAALARSASGSGQHRALRHESCHRADAGWRDRPGIRHIAQLGHRAGSRHRRQWCRGREWCLRR